MERRERLQQAISAAGYKEPRQYEERRRVLNRAMSALAVLLVDPEAVRNAGRMPAEREAV